MILIFNRGGKKNEKTNVSVSAANQVDELLLNLFSAMYRTAYWASNYVFKHCM